MDSTTKTFYATHISRVRFARPQANTFGAPFATTPMDVAPPRPGEPPV